MNKSNEIPDFKKIGEQLIKDVQTLAEVEMINFVMSNFEKQGFTDSGFTPWAFRKDNKDPGRAILIKDSTLMDSIEVTESSPDKVVVSASAEHAHIHNEGGRVNIPITKKMRQFFWFRFWTTQDPKFRAMALTKKKAFSFTMPQRQFMGNSESFNRHIETLFFKTIEQRFKQHLK